MCEWTEETSGQVRGEEVKEKEKEEGDEWIERYQADRLVGSWMAECLQLRCACPCFVPTSVGYCTLLWIR
jgi:hypothetical protein